MVKRPFRRDRLVAAWKQVPVVWLCGPRRVGKTILAKALPDAEYFNCDLLAAGLPRTFGFESGFVAYPRGGRSLPRAVRPSRAHTPRELRLALSAK